MRKFIIAPVVALLFVFSACDATEGTVYDKKYEAAKSWETTEPTYQYVCQTKTRSNYSNGQYRQESYQDCQNKHVGWHQEHHYRAECYKILFKNQAGDKGDDCVSPTEYEEIQEGDFYRE